MPKPAAKLPLVGFNPLASEETPRSIALGDRIVHYLLRRAKRRTALTKSELPVPIRTALDEYFSGSVEALHRLTARLDGTAFENAVWEELMRIPPGETRTYAEIARKIGNPQASRAVGAANGRNPIGVLVPCHRVIGANGSLTGYGGGLSRKQWLLDHEGALRSSTG